MISEEICGRFGRFDVDTDAYRLFSEIDCKVGLAMIRVTSFTVLRLLFLLKRKAQNRELSLSLIR